jgi:hypothetical protein
MLAFTIRSIITLQIYNPFLEKQNFPPVFSAVMKIRLFKPRYHVTVGGRCTLRVIASEAKQSRTKQTEKKNFFTSIWIIEIIICTFAAGNIKNFVPMTYTVR